MLPGAVLGAVAVLRMLAAAPTAGFSVNTFKWYQYAFTEARAIFSYIRLALFPIGQSLDHDFSTSHTIFEHGAIFYMALLAGSVVAVILLRRRYPLAGFGWLMFLTWLAPTSSVIPIDDALVERRMYLPLLGLILIGCEVVNRLKLKGPAIGVLATLIVFVGGGFCRARNQLWGKPETLLAAAAMEAKNNPRPLLNVAELMIKHNRCDLALPLLQRAERIIPGSYYVNASWGRALACLGHPEEGLQFLQKAAQMQPSSQVYEWIGLVYGKMGRLTDAGAAFQKAVQLDPQRASAHNALALWYEHIRDLESAEREYKKSLALDPENPEARSSLIRVVQLKETTRSRDAGEP
jgi:Tfp pilus assembly protein PilF